MWKLLEIGDEILATDEAFRSGRWVPLSDGRHPGCYPGNVVYSGLLSVPIRRKISAESGAGEHISQQPHTAICKCAGCRIECPKMDDCMVCIMQLAHKQQ